MRVLFSLLSLAGLTPAAILPFTFEPNVGQTAKQVRYLARGPQSTLWMTEREVVIGLEDHSRLAVLRMRFAGANHTPEIAGESPSGGGSSYFLGNDPEGWRRSVPQFGRVRYREIYPGTDVVFYRGPDDLEYDFRLTPGANPERIVLDFTGADQIRVDSQGDLIMRVGDRSIRHHKPRIFQGETAIGGGYRILGKHRVGFTIAEYDRARTLVIDPVLTYATYLGGQSADSGQAIAMDSQGFLYVTGATLSPDFPASAGLSKVLNGGGDAFVSKLNPAASGSSSLVWSTYLGGSALDAGLAIAVDSSGVYVTGITSSADFPILNAFQSTMRNDPSCQPAAHGLAAAAGTTCLDIFVTKVAPAGDALLYSSYLGGAETDVPSAIAVDGAGRVYIAGQTFSANFPIRGRAIQNTLRGSSDAFLVQISTDGRTLSFSSFFGGSADDFATSIALDSSGSVLIGGATLSADLPVQGAYLATPPGSEDGFIGEFNLSSNIPLLYLTYLGGPNGGTVVWGVGADTAGNLYAAGNTNSPNFPVSQNAFQAKLAGQPAADTTFGPGVGDGFVAKLNPAAQGSAQLVYASYLGGSSDEFVAGLAVDAAGRITIAGGTASADFPTTADALQCCYEGRPGNSKGFVARLDPSQSGAASLLYSTYLEGSSTDQINGLALSATGDSVAIVGSMNSTDMPVTPSAYQNFLHNLETKGAGSGDAYIARFDLSAAGPVIAQVENAAGLAAIQNAPLSPGLIFTITGTGLGPDTNTAPVIDSGRVATSVSAVQVLVDGTPAPLLYVSPTQINAIAPYELISKIGATVRVQAIYNGIAGNLKDVIVRQTAPAIFSFDDGSGQGAIRNADGSVNGSGNPAAKGSFISIYATGEGQLTPAGVDGQLLGSLSGPTEPVAAVSLSIGGVPIPAANILYAGATLFDGFFQLNAIIPASVPSGDVPVLLTIGGATSQPGLAVAIK